MKSAARHRPLNSILPSIEVCERDKSRMRLTNCCPLGRHCQGASGTRRLKHHNVQFADEGPVEAAGDMPLDPPIDRDLHAIQQRGTLTVLAPYNSTTYFLYRGEPMGYEYELLKAFAREHDLTLAIEVVKNQ